MSNGPAVPAASRCPECGPMAYGFHNVACSLDPEPKTRLTPFVWCEDCQALWPKGQDHEHTRIRPEVYPITTRPPYLDGGKAA
jgi:hypothetical protein